MQRFFFLRFPYREKIEDGKYVTVTNIEKRESIIAAIGYDEWKKRDEFVHLCDIDVPHCYDYIFGIFLDLYRTTNELKKITYSEILSYCQLVQITLSLYEIELIGKMNSWVIQIISELQEE